MSKLLTGSIIALLAVGAFAFLAFKLSPYPSVWFIRKAFNNEAIKVNKALAAFVPEGIETKRDIQYDPSDKDALLDAYYHKDSAAANRKLPVIVWTHGGGLISGTKDQLSNYCRILASKGYLVISIDYTIAPEGKYPTPIRQLNKALSFLAANRLSLPADTTFFVLAGDSGGSMVSAATANVITSAPYANLIGIHPGLHSRQLKGLLLYCGIYEVPKVNAEGGFGSFLKTVMWAYFGKKDISDDPYARTASVTNYLTPSFPPAFISAGNNDPLLPQSELLASKLVALKVPVDTLFFPKALDPGLEHEYQFTLDEPGKRALDRSVQFLQSIRQERPDSVSVKFRADIH